MAHLWSCWCGKYYRCDIEHPPRKNICALGDDCFHEPNCPDYLLHGPRQVKIAFETISSENFKGAEMQLIHNMNIRDIIEDNSVKWVTKTVVGPVAINADAIARIELPIEKGAK